MSIVRQLPFDSDAIAGGTDYSRVLHLDGRRWVRGAIPLKGGDTRYIILSADTCECGHSFRRAGVGYYTARGYTCKQCGELLAVHQTDREYDREQRRLLAAFSRKYGKEKAL